jgi:hypothetical protein
MGLGWHIQGKDASHVWHNGMTGGYASMLILETKQKFAVVVLSNVAASVDGPAVQIATALVKSHD